MTCFLYRHFDQGGKLLYLGISLNHIQRLAQHKNCSLWFEKSAKVTIERHESREKALEAERIAIIREKPAHNIQLRNADPREVRVAMSDASRLSLVRRLVTFKPVYNLSEAANLLNISTSTLKRFINNREITTIELRGKSLKITGWAIIDFLEWREELSRNKKAPDVPHRP